MNPPPNIIWIDDSSATFERLRTLWVYEGFSVKGQLHFANLSEAARETGPLLNQLAAKPPDVLVLDWHDGKSNGIYARLKDLVSLTVLVSWNQQHELKLAGVYQDHPELEKTTLTKPFSPEQLVALLALSRPPPAAVVLPPAAVLPPAGIKDAKGELEDSLAIRYLNDDLQPIGSTNGWQIDLNRPVLEFDDEQRRALLHGEAVRQIAFGSLPDNPSEFGPASFTTRLIPLDARGNWPTQAKYFQLGTASPPHGDSVQDRSRKIEAIVEMMAQAGFKRARYYELNDVPGRGAGRALELVLRSPAPSAAQGLLPIPASRAIDNEEREHLEAFAERLVSDWRQHARRRAGNTLTYPVIHDIRLVDRAAQTPNDDFWSRYVDDVNVLNRLEVPVFVDDARIGTLIRQGCNPLELLLGLFVFDRGGAELAEEVKDVHVRAVERPLLAALRYLASGRALERASSKERQAVTLLGIHEQLGKVATAPELEREVLALAVQAVDQGVPDANAHRSAMYAQYDPVHNDLVITSDTSGRMEGFCFTLTQTRFAVVQCAIHAKDAEPGDRLHPEFVPNYDDLAFADRLREQDWWEVPQCTEEWLERNRTWSLETIKTLIALPVVSGRRPSPVARGQPTSNRPSTLLGVLVVRSARPYEFTRERVDALERMIEVAVPYVERLQGDLQRDSWDTIVMHELRNSISWASGILDGTRRQATLADYDSKIKDACAALRDGEFLATGYLRWLGKTERDLDQKTDAAFWQELNDYGDLRARSSKSLRWSFERQGNLQCSEALLLMRALRILVDNAFRYSAEGGEVICKVAHHMRGATLVFQICNLYDVEDPRMRSRVAQPPAGMTQLVMPKFEIGLQLVVAVCAEVHGKFGFGLERTAAGIEQVVAELRWPIRSHRAKNRGKNS